MRNLASYEITHPIGFEKFSGKTLPKFTLNSEKTKKWQQCV